MEATVDPPGPDWMPITPKTGSLFHADSQTEAASRVERARILLAYRDDPSFFAVGRLLGVHHQTVQRCVERAADCGALPTLDDSSRPGKKPAITAEAKEWLVALACRKAKTSVGRPGSWPAMRVSMDLWLATPALPVWSKGPYAKFLERRDPEFEEKMARSLGVYKEVEILKAAAASSK